MIIYLDQNKWLDLAKAIVKPEENQEYIKVANLVLEKKQKGDWIFPLSAIHVFETGSRAEQKSRQNLVNVMADISNGYSIKSFSEIQKDELSNIFLKICAPEKVKPIKVILQNPLNMIGIEQISIDLKINLPLDIKQKIANTIESHFKENIPNQDISKMILNNYDQEFVDNLHDDDNILTEKLKKDRANLLNFPEKDRYNIFFLRRFFEHMEYYNIKIQQLCENNKVLKSIIDDKTQLKNFLEGAPSINTETKLTYDLLVDKERPIQKHDNRDLTFLCTAIPYCDVVITEKTWKHLVKKNKLDSKYSTRIEHDLNFLLKLEEQANKTH